jgi:hypothetical protein
VLDIPNYHFFPNPRGFFSADGVLPYKSSPLTREDRLIFLADGAQHSKMLPLAQAVLAGWSSRFKKAPPGPNYFGKGGAQHSKMLPLTQAVLAGWCSTLKNAPLAQAVLARWCSTLKNSSPGPS